MAKKKIWEFPENINPQPNLVFLVDESFTTQKLSLSGLTSSSYFSQFLAPVSSGTYDPNNGCITFTTNSGATFDVCGFSNGTVTGFTYDSNTNDLTILRVGLPDLTVNISGSSGISGISGISGLSGISGEVGVSGLSGISGVSGLSGISGVSGLSGISGVSGLSGISGVSGLDGTIYNTYVTGFTYNNLNTFTISQNQGQTPLSANISIMSGLTVNGLTKTSTLKVTSGATTNYVLVSDTDGNASWGPRIPDWSTGTLYYTKDLAIALYESEYRLFRALTGFTSSGVSFPGGQTIATDINSYTGQWQEVSPLRGVMTNVSFSGSVSFNGTITPPALTADTNNYNPTGLPTCNFIRLTNGTGSNINFTGLKAPNPVTNQAIFMCNVGTVQISILNNSVLSTVGNRFLVGGTKTLQNDEGIMVIYDPVSLAWRSQAIQI